MYILFLLLWIIFNGSFTVEIFLFGLGISALIFLFSCLFMDYSIQKDIAIIKKAVTFLEYMGILIWEIIKANVAMAWIIVVKQEYELHPVIFKYKTNLKTDACKALLANSITLTQGTITVSMIDDVLIINAIDSSLKIEDSENFVFEKILKKLEGDRSK